MSQSPTHRYVSRPARLPSSGETRWVVIDSEGAFHEESTKWLQYLYGDGTGSSPNTAASYGPKVALYLTWMSERGFAWREATLSTLAAWSVFAQTRLLESGPRKGQRPKPSTAAAYVQAVLAFYKWAGGVEDLVAAELVSSFFRWQQIGTGHGGERGGERLVLRPELVVAVPESAPQWIPTRAEADALLAVPMKPRDWFLVALLLTTGVRIGEALSLFRADMHLTATSLALGCSKSGPHIHVHQDNETLNGERTKDKRGRVVPLPVALVHAYEDYRHERAQILGEGDVNPHVFVNLYASRRGEAVKSDSLRDLFRRLSRASGVHVTAHTFRHTRASWWLHGVDGPKADVEEVKELLGHASLKTTSGYLHTTDERLREVVESTAPLLRGEPDRAGGRS